MLFDTDKNVVLHEAVMMVVPTSWPSAAIEEFQQLQKRALNNAPHHAKENETSKSGDTALGHRTKPRKQPLQ